MESVGEQKVIRCPRCSYAFGHPRRLQKLEVKVLEGLASGFHGRELAEYSGSTLSSVKTRVRTIARLFGIPASERWVRIRLVDYWLSPLFQIGLRELGML